MDIVKNDNYFQIILDNVSFLIDPAHLNFDTPIILTDYNKNLNKDKIFSSPGEYNIGSVYFWGFNNYDRIIYYFKSTEGSLLLLVNKLKDDVLKRIKLINKEIDAFFFINFLDKEIISIFKPKLILVDRNIDIPNFKKQIGKRLKVNLKKVDKLVFIFD